MPPQGCRFRETITPCGAAGLELYGPVDALFPEWKGRVTRGFSDAEAAILHSYRSGCTLVRITNHYVSASLRDRLQRHASSTCGCADQVQAIETMRADPRSRVPVVMIGLRVENRTHHDLAGLLVRLLERIAARYPGAIAILDGHNTRVGAGGDMIESHGQSLASEHPARVERQLVDRYANGWPLPTSVSTTRSVSR